MAAVLFQKLTTCGWAGLGGTARDRQSHVQCSLLYQTPNAIDGNNGRRGLPARLSGLLSTRWWPLETSRPGRPSEGAHWQLAAGRPVSGGHAN